MGEKGINVLNHYYIVELIFILKWSFLFLIVVMLFYREIVFPAQMLPV